MTRVSRLGGAFQCSCNRIVEALERRVLLSAFTVTNVNDSGPGSLRQAILDADSHAGADTISFDIPGSGARTIAPASPLPVITDLLTINGTTQPGYSQSGGAPLVELSGVAAGAGANGLVFASAGNVFALAINRFAGSGLLLQGSNVTVSGCFIGTDASGRGAAGNGQDGVVILGREESLGGAGAKRNVISANGLAGVFVGSAGNVALGGNYIGTDSAGSRALGNGQEGLLVTGTVSSQDPVGAQDVISANGYSGILEVGSTANLSLFAAYVGTNAAGSAALGNGANPGAPYRDGITVLGGRASIGLTQPGEPARILGNLISGNNGAGINVGSASSTVIEANLIGTDATGLAAIGNKGNGIVLASTGAQVGTGNLAPANSPPTARGGNVIAANGGDGILILSSNNSVQNNYIGLDLAGAAAGNHGSGVEIHGTSNHIGMQRGNVISANGAAGISIVAPPPTGEGAVSGLNTIQSNLIGSDPTGTAPLGNAGNGIEVFSSANTIGAGDSGSGNLIIANGGSGILLGDFNGVAEGRNRVTDNSIGLALNNAPNAGDGITIFHSTNNLISLNTIAAGGGSGVSVSDDVPNGTGATGNLITRNTFVPGSGLPIDLGDDGPTPNDPGDQDLGPNLLQNFPVIQSAVAKSQNTAVQFQLDTAPGTYTVEFYTTTTAPSSVAGTRDFLGSASVTVGTNASAVYTATLPQITPGQALSAIASDSLGNTSEFSPAEISIGTPPRLTFAQYTYFTVQKVITLHFDQDVSSGLLPSAVKLHNLHTGADVTPLNVSFDPSTDSARFVLPDSLPDGYYQVTVSAAGIMNSAGQHLDGNGDGVGGDDLVYNLYSLTGDVNGDHTVDFNDLVLLAQGYGTSQGGLDINQDGIVDFKDLLILAQQYGKQVTGT